MRPKDFWVLHPEEFWWISEAKRPPKNYSGMTESEAAALYEETYGED